MFRMAMRAVIDLMDVGDHVRVSPNCGICTDTIFIDEKAIALFGKDNVYKSHTGRYPLPSIDTCTLLCGENVFCRTMECPCEPPDDVTTVHAECFDIFIRFCERKGIRKELALHRLWIFAAWRLPWEDGPFMDASYIPADLQSLQIVGQLSGIPHLHKLPPELVIDIWKASRHSLFWKCVSVTRLVAQVEAKAHPALKVVPLDKVHSWQRGGRLECGPAFTTYPVTRLTIDQEGIKKVEQLSSIPQYTGELHTNFNYIVENRASLGGIEAHLQDGRLRLQFASSQLIRPYMWNTPAPPPLPLCRSLLGGIFDSRQLRVVDTQNIQGITFFFMSGQLLSLYIHQSDESCASEMYEQLSDSLRGHTAWLYVPIPKTDKLVVLGTRHFLDGLYSLLIRMEKAGDINIGRAGFFADYAEPTAGKKKPTESPDQCLSANGPVTFLYGEPKDGFVVPFLGAYNRTSSAELDSPNLVDLPRGFLLEKSGFENLQSEHGYYSRAPLSQVLTSTVFYHPISRCCRGILLKYENGGCRALGQCRVNVDASDTVDRPQQICIRVDRRVRRVHGLMSKYLVPKVLFIHDFEEDTVSKEWKRHPLEGFIEFWFHSNDDIHIQVTATQFNNDSVRDIEWQS